MTLTEQVFTLHLATRKKLVAYLEIFSPEELVKIPNGFSNNVLWNIAHCVATQQILCNRFSGLPTLVSDDFINAYRKGTFPTGEIPTTETIETLKKLLISTSEQLHTDYKNGVFQSFTPYQTSYGFELKSIEDAIQFTLVHENMHLGTIIALNYFLK